VKARARNKATVSASPSTNTAVVLEVGASPKGQASCDTAASKWMSACCAMLDCGLPVMQIRRTFLRLMAGMMARISSFSPELDRAIITSPSTTMPKSPWAASAGWIKNAGVPVEASEAAILRPMWPLLPMPVITTRPLALKIASTAWLKR
jgi:hypothetical protein